jgi:phage terminase small subunit
MPILTNPRHERFAQELAAGKSAAEAHGIAGYKPNRGNASHLQSNQSIQKRVAELLQERENIHNQATAKAVEATALTKEWVIAKLIENANRAMQAEAHRDGNGKPIGEYSYNGAVANRALELLGKELGMFIDRKEVGSPGEFERMTDEELLEEVHRQAVELLQLKVH